MKDIFNKLTAMPPETLNAEILKLGGYAHKGLYYLVLASVFLCLTLVMFSTLFYHTENTLKLKFAAQASQDFERDCAANKGTVSIINTFNHLDIYCAQKDGSETSFHTKYKGANFIDTLANAAIFSHFVSHQESVTVYDIHQALQKK